MCKSKYDLNLKSLPWSGWRKEWWRYKMSCIVVLLIEIIIIINSENNNRKIFGKPRVLSSRWYLYDVRGVRSVTLTYKSFLERAAKFDLSRYCCLSCVLVDASWAPDDILALVLDRGVCPTWLWISLTPGCPHPPLWPGSLPATEPAAHFLRFSTDSANSRSKFCLARQ